MTTAYTYANHAGYRCLRPDRRSRFTGFRIVRTAEPHHGVKAHAVGWSGEGISSEHVSAGDRLPSVLVGRESGKRITTIDTWGKERERIRGRWTSMLGVPPAPDRPPQVREIRTFHGNTYTGKLLFLEFDEQLWIKLFVMIPLKARMRPMPAVIVHWYDVDTPSGRNLGGYHVHEDSILKAYGAMMCRYGIAAASVQWWDLTEEGYEESMAMSREVFPKTLGLGRIQTIYSAALEERLAVAVACGSNCSVSNEDSNYYDYWYLRGAVSSSIERTADQQELLALVAPRPFLMALGKGNYIDPCIPFAEAAREVYDLYGKRASFGFIYDKNERPPSSRNVPLMRDWLVHHLTGAAVDGTKTRNGTK